MPYNVQQEEKQMSNDLKRLDFRVPERYKDVLKQWCELEGISQTHYMIEHLKLLEKKLRKRKNESRKH